MSEKTKPLVSVIVITYNSSTYLIETLESVRAQTWRNIELIISDDGSTDNTVQICSDWMKENSDRFHNTKIITVEKNRGIASNCNRGIEVADGEWLKLIAGDDILLDNCIRDNLGYSKQFPEASFIISDLLEIDENSNLLSKQKMNEGLIYFTKQSSIEKQLKAYTRWPAFLNSPTFFYKKELIYSIDFCDEEFMIYDDMCLIYKTISKNKKIYYLNKPTVKYRIHPNSTSRNGSINDRRVREVVAIFDKYRKKNLNIFNPIDLSIYYENWLRYKYKGYRGHKGFPVLLRFSLFYWHLRLNGVKSY